MKKILQQIGINPTTDCFDMDFAVVDTETCGIWKASRIVEIAAVKIIKGKIKEPISWLVNPEIPIPPQTTEIHGITDQDINNKPHFGKVFPEFLKYVQNTILIAHNSEYDEGIISTNATRYRVNFPKMLFLDTLSLAREILPQMESYSLGNLAKSLGISHNKLHRAGEDTKTTAKLFLFLLSQAKKEGISSIYNIAKRSSIRFLGDSASNLSIYPSHLPHLAMAVLTKADIEFFYLKNDKIITIPGTIICTFTFNGHSYVEIRDHETEQILTLRTDRIKKMQPIY